MTLPRTLLELGDLAELRGAGTVSHELRHAASLIAALGVAEGQAMVRRAVAGQGDRAGVGPTALGHIRTILDAGDAAALRAGRARLPRLMRRLLELSALSASDAVKLARQAGVLTTADLGVALDTGRVTSLLGETVASQLLLAPEAVEADSAMLTLGRAWDLLDPLMGAIEGACPALGALTPAGDVRRSEPLVSSLILVGHAAEPQSIVDALCGLKEVDDVLHRSGRRAILAWRQTEVDVRVTAPEEAGTVLFRATGSRPHVAALHERRPLPRLAAREEDVYAHAGLAYIPPELRHMEGEIEAAAAKGLPTLIDRADIRGDLHLHTTYSDGRDTLAAMVEACAALGYEYIAITDHSEHAAASRTLTIDQLARQRDEIARLREQYPAMAILHGIEVDILPDGRLDFADAVLEPLDLVLASLHDAARQPARQLTRRCIQAIRHPLVNIITHPANRLVGHRPGYDLDFATVYAAAAETGTALEIDGAPSHLDLDGTHAREAVRAGVTVTVDSDCHRVVALERQMRLGIGTARRGWVEPHQVLNTRPLEGVRAFVRSKRARCG